MQVDGMTAVPTVTLPHPQHIKLHYEGLYTEVGGGMEKDKWSVDSPFSNPILLMSCPMGMCGQLT